MLPAADDGSCDRYRPKREELRQPAQQGIAVSCTPDREECRHGDAQAGHRSDGILVDRRRVSVHDINDALKVEVHPGRLCRDEREEHVGSEEERQQQTDDLRVDAPREPVMRS